VSAVPELDDTPPSLALGADAADDSERDPFLNLKYGATEICLIRHGDAVPDPDDVLPGDYDDQNLSALGRRQAEALAARLRDLRFDALYTSPLRRTQQTAEPLARALALQPVPLEGLREIRLGSIGPELPDGAKPSEVAENLRERLRMIAARAAATGTWDSIPGSEPSAAFRARVVAAHEDAAGRHPGGRIACFEHGGTINSFTAAVLGLERDFFFPVANTAVSIVRVKGPRRVLFALNDIAHLRDAGLLPPLE
jgi:2,3-bisphosphoglycerate-dependent phosphoglycerate mutase